MHILGAHYLVYSLPTTIAKSGYSSFCFVQEHLTSFISLHTIRILSAKPELAHGNYPSVLTLALRVSIISRKPANVDSILSQSPHLLKDKSKPLQELTSLEKLCC